MSVSNPITEQEYAAALKFLTDGLASLIKAQLLFRRFADSGMLNESEQIDRCTKEIDAMNIGLAKAKNLRNKLKQRDQRKKEIERERKKLSSK